MVASTIHTNLQALLHRESQKKHTHNSLLAVQSQDGKVDFTGVVGNTQADDPYFMASITKMYTTAVIMQLADERKLDLNAPINAYLPPDLIQGIHVYQGTDYSQQLKVYQLLHQTSGLADYFEDKRANGSSLMDDIKQGKDREWNVAQVMDDVRQMTPKFAPSANHDKKSHYSDTNYQLLGAIIEDITGQHIAVNYQQRIFDQLGLIDTYLYNHEDLRDGQQPMLFYDKDTPLDIPQAMSSFGADGGIVSTLSESLRFLKAYFDGDLFDNSHFPRMMQQWNMIYFPVQYGYGVMRFQLPRFMTLFRYSPELLGHSGASGSFAFFAPKEGVYIVGTFNQVDAPSRPFRFMLKVVDMMLA